MLNKQVLRVGKPTNHALKNTSLRIEKLTNHTLQNTYLRVEHPISPNDFCPFNNPNSSKTFTLNRKHVSRQAHPLLWRGLGRLPLRTCSATHIPPFPLTSPPSEGLGEAPSLWFLGSLLWCVLFVFCQFLSFLLFNLRPFAR